MTEAPSAPSDRRLVDGVTVLGSLSPSRAGDFLSCPLLYRFRTVDQLPEPYSVDAVRGTVVHKVLEDLFDLPATDRTPERAHALVEPAWAWVQEAEPEVAELFDDEDAPSLASWLATCRAALDRYFTLEDPRRLEPAEREMYVETLLESKLLLRGVIDRLDVAPDGAIRVVDYKGLALDTPLPTPTGWTTMAEVQVGDRLIGRDGQPTQVMRKSGVHHRPCYRITFRDGSSVVCDNVHLWEVTTTHRHRQTTQVLAADDLYQAHVQSTKQGRRDSMWIKAGIGLDVPDVDDLPVDPWLLGAWLGDGYTDQGSFAVGKADIEDMLTLFKQHWPGEISVSSERTAFAVRLLKLQGLCEFGHRQLPVANQAHVKRRCKRAADHSRSPRWNVSLGAVLDRVGVRGNKHIPEIYLRAGTGQRLALLRGLMDTDGWWNARRRRAGFTTANDRLATDVVQLLRTLGVHPQHFSKPYRNRVRPDRTWHIIEFTPSLFNPFSLPRKAAHCDGGVGPVRESLAKRRIIASIEPVESVPTQCVSVDAPDSLYLCGDGFIPTHNTGRSPSAGFEWQALFQLKFYALALWRERGVVPRMLRLVYLGDGQTVSYEPDEADLRATERKVQAIWAAISRAQESGDWRPRRSRLCDWCAHQSICPEFGGTPPPLPDASGSDLPVGEERDVPAAAAASPLQLQPGATHLLGASEDAVLQGPDDPADAPA